MHKRGYDYTNLIGVVAALPKKIELRLGIIGGITALTRR
jgi:hypothetical protein